MRWSPCGNATCAVAAQGLPLKCCALAATRNPSRHVDATHDPQHVRSIVGQAAAALVSVFGSCPKVRYGAPAIVLACAPAAVAPLDTCIPDDLENV